MLGVGPKQSTNQGARNQNHKMAYGAGKPKWWVTLCAALALCVLLAGLVARVWANARRNALPQLSLVHIAPGGALWVLVGGQFYVESRSGAETVWPLKHFGLGELLGDFAVLQDGSLLLPAHDVTKATVHQDLALATRLDGHEDSDRSDSTPLKLCALATGKCAALDGTGERFRTRHTFKLVVDEAADRIYVSDTPNGRLVMLDRQGRILAEKLGFNFPNGLALDGRGHLLVADTNDSSIAEIALTATGFGHESVRVRCDYGNYRFPTGFAYTPAGTLWVSVADNNLEHSILVRIPAGASIGTVLSAERGAQLGLPVLLTDGSVIVADSMNYRLEHFASDGARLADVSAPLLGARLYDLNGRNVLYTRIVTEGWWLLVLAAVPIFGIAYWFQVMGKGHTRESLKAPNRGGTATGALGLMSSEAASSPSAKRYTFNRRFAFISRRSGRHLQLAILVMVILAYTILLVSWGRIAYFPLHRSRMSANAWAQAWVAIVLPFLFAGYRWIQQHDHLTLDANGIRHDTPFTSALAFLARMSPSWALRWNEITDIELRALGNAGTPNQWYYSLKTSGGRTQRLSALGWKRSDALDDVALTYMDLMRQTPEKIHTAIAQTELYRLMSLALRSGKIGSGSEGVRAQVL